MLIYFTATHNALILIIPKRALVADTDKRRRSDVTIADWALAIALVTQTAYSYTWLLPAHYQIPIVLSAFESLEEGCCEDLRMMARHDIRLQTVEKKLGQVFKS